MYRRSSFSPALTLLVLWCLVVVSAAQSPVVQVVFTDGAVAPGWKRYKSGKLSDGVALTASDDEEIPLEYRSYASKKKAFTYEQKVKPGTYEVVLGFAEFGKKTCKNNRRVFDVDINGQTAGPIDVFKSAGCAQPYTEKISGIVVEKNRKLIISLSKVRGKPFLANFQVFKMTMGVETTATPEASPVQTPEVLPSPIPSPSKPKGKTQIVYDIDVGGLTDLEPSTGTTNVFPNVFPIEGTDEDAKFSRHRFGPSFMYSLTVQPNINYNIELFFAENFVPNCVTGNRVFDVFVYDGSDSPDSGKALNDLDIFDLAGCQTAYSVSVSKVKIGSSGILAIQFSATMENAMISAILVTTKDKKYKPIMTTPEPVSKVMMAEIDVGGPSDKFVPGTSKFATMKKVKKSKAASPEILQTSRFGPEFVYSFNLTPGEYEITLSFAETFEPHCDVEGLRVFDVLINDAIVVEGLDIFKTAGCRKGVDFVFMESVKEDDMKPLTIRFKSTTNFATVNYIRIMKIMM